MTYNDFEKLTSKQQNDYLEKLISKLSFKRKDPLITVIDYMRLLVDDHHNNTYWNIYKFEFSLEELTSKFKRLNSLRIGV